MAGSIMARARSPEVILAVTRQATERKLEKATREAIKSWKLYQAGLTVIEIHEAMSITRQTVYNHLARIRLLIENQEESSPDDQV